MDRPVDYLHQISAAAERMAAACEAAPDAPIPSCPDWDMPQLVSHMGRIHRWVTELNAAAAMEAVPRGLEPPPDTDWPNWLREGAAALVDVLGAADPDAPVWNPFGQPPSGRFWARRQAQETSIHRWDADSAAALAAPVWEGPSPLDAELAADGIDELLHTYLLPRTNGRSVGRGETIHLHATDAEAEWLLTLSPDGIRAEPIHAKGDVALRGTASDLYLWAWGRLAGDDPCFEVHGDRSVAALWHEVARW